ncbi:MAG: hypothetical protein KKA76_07710 [Proteobacteria bacterium]|nr:hypothetical protein [Pseudomonadota bacterium]
MLQSRNMEKDIKETSTAAIVAAWPKSGGDLSYLHHLYFTEYSAKLAGTIIVNCSTRYRMVTPKAGFATKR